MTPPPVAVAQLSGVTLRYRPHGSRGCRRSGHSRRLHGRLHRAGRGRQIQFARVALGSTQDPGGPRQRAGRRYGQYAPPPRGLSAPCLHAPGTGQRICIRPSQYAKTWISSAGCSASQLRSEPGGSGSCSPALALAPFADRPAGKLSGGMKQKLRTVLRPDPRPGLADSGRAHHRR